MNASTNVRFEVREGVSGTNRDEWSILGTYETGKEAADAKGAIDASPGCVLAVVRVVGEPEGDPNWRDREEARFLEGRYKPVPWLSDDTYDRYGMRFAGYPDHFAHLAESDNRKIAFTEDDAKGRKDIQKVLSVTDYLSRYFSDCSRGCSCCESPSYMKSNTQRAFVEEIEGLSTEVQYATTADEIQEVYEASGGTDCEKSSCGSCMGYRAGRFATQGIHPTRVYAAGDLQVAYLRSSEGLMMARCLVWPANKLAGRIYGNSHAALKTALRAAGYTSFDHVSLIGARLLRLPIPGHSDRFVMPYIDGTQRFEDDGDYFAIASSDGTYEAANTDGTAFVTAPIECARCDDDMHPNDAYTVGGERWCEDCHESYAFSCAHCGESSHEDDAEQAHFWAETDTVSVCGRCRSRHYVEADDGEFYRPHHVTHCMACDTTRPNIEPHYGACDCEDSETDDADADPIVTAVYGTTPPLPPVPTAIDWTLPIETVDGIPARLSWNFEPERHPHPSVYVPSLDTGNDGPWMYNVDGTSNDFLPRLCNVRQPVAQATPLEAVTSALLAPSHA